MSPASGEARPPAVPAAEVAYAAARRAIVECRLLPGQRFTELELARLLESGRTPVREALGRLRQEGLVEAFPRAGYRVTPITLKDVREIFEVRSMIEGHVAQALASSRLSDAETDAISDADASSYSVATEAEREVWMKANTAFHLGLAQKTGNRRLVKALEQVLNEMERLLRLGWGRSALLGQHAVLIDAIRSGAPAAARQVAEDSVARSMENTMKSILESPEVESLSL